MTDTGKQILGTGIELLESADLWSPYSNSTIEEQYGEKFNSFFSVVLNIYPDGYFLASELYPLDMPLDFQDPSQYYLCCNHRIDIFVE